MHKRLVILVIAAVMVWLTACGDNKGGFVSLKIENEAIKVAAGATEKVLYRLSRSAEAVGELVFSSSDESIAVVDPEGIVTGVSSGSCTVTLTYLDCSASVDVFVFASPESSAAGDGK